MNKYKAILFFACTLIVSQAHAMIREIPEDLPFRQLSLDGACEIAKLIVDKLPQENADQEQGKHILLDDIRKELESKYQNSIKGVDALSIFYKVLGNNGFEYKTIVKAINGGDCHDDYEKGNIGIPSPVDNGKKPKGRWINPPEGAEMFIPPYFKHEAGGDDSDDEEEFPKLYMS